MPASSSTAQAKRDLRLRIARQRRRIDRQIRSLRREGARLLSWQTYLARIPLAAVSALGAGFSGLASLPRRRWVRTSFRYLRRVVSLFARKFWAWVRPQRATSSHAEPTANLTPSGGDDGF